MKEQLNTLKLAAWTLITIGTIETIFLIHAVMSRTSFSGGAFLYIIAGIFLFKKNRTDYKFLLVTFTALFALIPGGVILLGWMAAQIYTATDLPLVWSGPGAAALIFVVYLGLVLALVGLLYHPNTRSAMGLEPYQGTVHTLYMSKPRFITLLALSIVFAGLLGGPHILHNPYKVAGPRFPDGAPKWWRKLFMTRPRRRENKHICWLVLHGADPEGLTAPLGNHKPHWYYW